MILSAVFCLLTRAQTVNVEGKVVDNNGLPLIGVNVTLADTREGTITNDQGRFTLPADSTSVTLTFSFVGYETRTLRAPEQGDWEIVLNRSTTLLEDVQVSESAIQEDPAIITRIDATSAQNLPSAFGEFSQVLATLPGVANNNELSSVYSVRGGNFDENLVYVGDIPIYRPFLANSGRQEGLSFVNTDLVENINFYAGGWSAKYGDKLSSSLNIGYRTPENLEGGITLGLLGGRAHMGGVLADGKVNFLVGARHRDSQYLLNTLEVEGEYFPRFTDVQSQIGFRLSEDTQITSLFSYARNRYLTNPTSQQTEFGSVQQNFRLQTAFVGREILNYDTYQAGAKLSHRFSEVLRSHLIVSGVHTVETENYEVEGFYRLCDIDNDPNSSAFDECVTTRALGSNFSYGRNALEANVVNTEIRNEWLVNDENLLELGVGISYQSIRDEINEYAFIDSSDFVTITEQVFNELEINSLQYTGYVQNTSFFSDSSHILTYGVRVNYWDENREWLLSPRAQYLFRVSPVTHLRLATGIYSQPPFYREFRDRQGNIVEGIKAQKSFHIIAGIQQTLKIWNRDFIITGEVYWKRLWDVVAYDVENIRLRYFANNDATAFARGFDVRINGEFIKGAQSWFSLGILQTQEKLPDDGRGYIRRPTDQRVNIGSYFEDHIPGDPTVRVYLNMNIGSGYPFGPPDSEEFRNVFNGDEYYRVDVGLSKYFQLKRKNFFNEIILRFEVLNALAADNTLSYTWIEDVRGANFAIPNSLSARFLNVKLSTKF